MSKVLIITGDAAESLEVMYPYRRLKEEGYEVHIGARVSKSHFRLPPLRKSRALARSIERFPLTLL
jgi:putative intracellular protease/amidase